MVKCKISNRCDIQNQTSNVNCKNRESVIYEDSYAQLNPKLTIDKIAELKKSRKTNNKLSKKKLEYVLNEYKEYQLKYNIDEHRIVHMTREEILDLNSEII